MTMIQDAASSLLPPNISHIVEQVKSNSPVVLSLTNHVTMGFVANVLLAVGASPIMCLDKRELQCLISICHGLYINIGTLTPEFVSLAEEAVGLATAIGKPIVLDPVGAGATTLRTKISKDLLPYVSLVKGNASEIISLWDGSIKETSFKTGEDLVGSTRGVDSVHTPLHGAAYAKAIAAHHNISVVITGERDYLVTPTGEEGWVSLGSPLMRKVTGMGCALGGVLAAFIASEKDRFQGMLAAVHYMGFCGGKAEELATLPGSFSVAFLDMLALYGNYS